jgi:hypothetical protein
MQNASAEAVRAAPITHHSTEPVASNNPALEVRDQISGAERFTCALFWGRQLLDYRSLRELMG